jgi:hypothetical protein
VDLFLYLFYAKFQWGFVSYQPHTLFSFVAHVHGVLPQKPAALDFKNIWSTQNHILTFSFWASSIAPVHFILSYNVIIPFIFKERAAMSAWSMDSAS